MDVSIIIVNWNSLEYTLECVASIEEHVRDLTYEVIVVDNASQDAPCSVLRQAFPWVKLYCLNQNLGFAAGNNFAAAVSSGNKLLFLNPDTKVLGNAIQVMARQLESHPSVGAVGCRLLNRDLTVQLSSVQRFPTITNQLFGLELVQKLLPLSVIWGTKPLCPSESSQLLEVEVVSGACLMVRREVYEAVGHFSTEYFMYAEETDLCSKIRNSGWKVCHVGSAQIVHYGGESTKKVRPLISRCNAELGVQNAAQISRTCICACLSNGPFSGRCDSADHSLTPIGHPKKVGPQRNFDRIRKVVADCDLESFPENS